MAEEKGNHSLSRKIEEILTNLELKYAPSSVGGYRHESRGVGLLLNHFLSDDVSSEVSYIVELPRKKAGGLLGIFGKTVRTMEREDVVREINQALYSTEGAHYLGRTSNPQTREDYVRYAEPVTARLHPSLGFIDVVNLRFK